MENRKEEFLKTICQIYMTALLVVLPLYYIPWNGYYKLGDTKYYLYRNISLLCLGVCLVVELLAAVNRWWIGGRPGPGRLLRRAAKTLPGSCREHSVTTAVCLYGLCAVISACCSPYGNTAWLGEREWYMGAVTICLMTGGFLLAANYGADGGPAILLGETAFVLVTLIGLGQKLGYDPLGILKGYIVGDWEFTHMISTLGNNNWLCGYYSVLFPFSLALFRQAVREGKKLQGVLLCAANVLAMMLLLLQGSDSGVILAGVAIGFSFWLDREDGRFWEPLLLLLSATALGVRIWGAWMRHLGTYDILVQDGIAKKLAVWNGWIPLAVIGLLFCGYYHKISQKNKKILQKVVLYGSMAVAVIAVVWYLGRILGTDFAEWGNRRGKLWQMAWSGFWQGDFHQKLLGAGPDCFAEYLGELLPGGTVLFDKGYFEGSIFTNAHNEWLTTLVNLGLLGTVSYGAVFVTAACRHKKDFAVLLLLLTYGVHSLISFQQVLNAPFFFLVLGLYEAGSRKNTDRADHDNIETDNIEE